MIRKYVLTALALAGFALAVWTVRKGSRPAPVSQPVAMPSHAPYSSYVAGAALVEPRSEDIAIGAILPGVVIRVEVKPGQAVKAGDPLFTVDDRASRAALATKESALLVAQQELRRLEAFPRPEEIPPAEARLEEAGATLADLQSQYDMMERVGDKRAVSEEELIKRRFAVRVAETRVSQAKASLDLLRAGAFRPEIEVSRANMEAARAEVEAARVDVERHTVRAPIAGEALRVRVRAGEYASSGERQEPLIILGDVSRLHLRVDVDENDAWRIRPGAEATAFVRGNNSLRTPARFERVEPYIVPKRSLTGASTERVDTRVLQIIYSFEKGELPVYVGQQMDVFIEAPPIGAATQTPREAPQAATQ